MGKNEFVCDCNVIHRQTVDKVNSHMLNENTLTKVSNFFKVLGDKTRLKIAWALMEDEMCVCDLANVLNMSKSAVSHQLASLRKANLVRFRRDGKTVYYAISDEHVKMMVEGGLEHVHE